MSKKIQENLTVEETVSAEITVDVAESTVSDKNENLSSVITEKDVMKERDIEKIEKRQRAAKITAQVFIYIFLTVMALIVVFPFYWMIISSLKSYEEYTGHLVPTFWPTEGIDFANYLEAFKT